MQNWITNMCLGTEIRRIYKKKSHLRFVYSKTPIDGVAINMEHVDVLFSLNLYNMHVFCNS